MVISDTLWIPLGQFGSFCGNFAFCGDTSLCFCSYLCSFYVICSGFFVSPCGNNTVIVGGGSLCVNFSLLKLFYAFLWLFSYVIVLLWCMFLMCLQNFYRCEHGHGIF